MNERYEFIDAEYATPDTTVGPAPTVAQMCTWLGVSKSGFYDWRSRPTSVTAARRRILAVKVKVLFERSHRTYAHRRVHAELVRGGERVGVELARRLMREQDLHPCQPRPYKTTTIRDDAAAGPVPDLVRWDFTAAAPGTTLVGDITYIRTWQDWLYLATVIDCFNREVVGYATAEHMRTDLVVDALGMAARNHRLEPGCVFHSDHGSQYLAVHLERVPRHPQVLRDAPVAGPHGYLFRQRFGRVVQWCAQDRAGAPHGVSDPEEGGRGYCPLPSCSTVGAGSTRHSGTARRTRSALPI